jgi:hypothetical protein
MPDDRTTVTELATALGTLPYPNLSTVLAARPSALQLAGDTWGRLAGLYQSGQFAAEFRLAYANGRALLEALDGLRGRHPRLIEWTGGRRPPGDEVAPIDLRIDHVYLVSCKYLSANIANASPARLFDGLLATTGTWDRGDWYQAVAPAEYQALYDACRQSTSLDGLPATPAQLTRVQHRQLRDALRGRSYPPSAQPAYRALTRSVSIASANRWQQNLSPAGAETMLWRLLRIGNAPYFLLGSHGQRPLRLRIATAWDWRRDYRLRRLAVSAGDRGQPHVDWVATYTDRGSGSVREVRGHVEVRWSHGRFSQPPEAKIYLDTPADKLPGYFALDEPHSPPTLWSSLRPSLDRP